MARKYTLAFVNDYAYISAPMQKATPLRNLRRARTLTQTDMARLLNISQQTYSKYESGRLRPSADVQARIAALLGASRSELFGDDTEREAVAS
jgi:transcriptional regulator with XRE-family HTH domain